MPKSLSGFKKQIWIQHGLPEVSEMGRRGVFCMVKMGWPAWLRPLDTAQIMVLDCCYKFCFWVGPAVLVPVTYSSPSGFWGRGRDHWWEFKLNVYLPATLWVY